MLKQILVTQDEYKAIAFTFVLVGILFTLRTLFGMPHEREEND